MVFTKKAKPLVAKTVEAPQETWDALEKWSQELQIPMNDIVRKGLTNHLASLSERYGWR